MRHKTVDCRYAHTTGKPRIIRCSNPSRPSLPHIGSCMLCIREKWNITEEVMLQEKVEEVNCVFMENTGELAVHNRRCQGTKIFCRNPDCPLKINKSINCKLEKCTFFVDPKSLIIK